MAPSCTNSSLSCDFGGRGREKEGFAAVRDHGSGGCRAEKEGREAGGRGGATEEVLGLVVAVAMVVLVLARVLLVLRRVLLLVLVAVVGGVGELSCCCCCTHRHAGNTEKSESPR